MNNFQVVCCNCGNESDFYDFNNSSKADRFFRSEGWKKKRNRWRCPECVEEK